MQQNSRQKDGPRSFDTEKYDRPMTWLTENGVFLGANDFQNGECAKICMWIGTGAVFWKGDLIVTYFHHFCSNSTQLPTTYFTSTPAHQVSHENCGHHGVARGAMKSCSKPLFISTSFQVACCQKSYVVTRDTKKHEDCRDEFGDPQKQGISAFGFKFFTCTSWNRLVSMIHETFDICIIKYRDSQKKTTRTSPVQENRSFLPKIWVNHL